ncbi:hypothetical protein ABE288_27900 [Bacillus salipaludis]|uniref:hypothetical protein n=1 Tax=Bacillus salipaludis TaxID=2547811 RepID=UPI003D23B183
MEDKEGEFAVIPFDFNDYKPSTIQEAVQISPFSRNSEMAADVVIFLKEYQIVLI